MLHSDDHKFMRIFGDCVRKNDLVTISAPRPLLNDNIEQHDECRTRTVSVHADVRATDREME